MECIVVNVCALSGMPLCLGTFPTEDSIMSVAQASYIVDMLFLVKASCVIYY